MILVEQTKNIQGAIRCPYHSWCYSTEGKLVSTPHVGGPGQNTDKHIDKSKEIIEGYHLMKLDGLIIIGGDGSPPRVGLL